MIHTLTVLDYHGDTPTIWDDAEVEAARKVEEIFRTHIRNGGLAFTVDGKTNTATRSWDEVRAASQTILSPRLVGG